MAAAGTSREDVSFYRAFGAVKVRGVISRGEAERFRAEAMKLLNAGPVSELDISGVNEQRPQVWKSNPTLRALTMHPRIGAAAQRLAGVPLRLWHDDIIAKPPKNEGPTRPHQDVPLWPLGKAGNSLSAWVALQDTSVEMGCMTFALGSQRWTALPKDVAHGRQPDAARKWLHGLPEIGWLPRLTIPLQAGDCTFHHGYAFHMAGPNTTDQWRSA